MGLYSYYTFPCVRTGIPDFLPCPLFISSSFLCTHKHTLSYCTVGSTGRDPTKGSQKECGLFDLLKRGQLEQRSFQVHERVDKRKAGICFSAYQDQNKEQYFEITARELLIHCYFYFMKSCDVLMMINYQTRGVRNFWYFYYQKLLSRC